MFRDQRLGESRQDVLDYLSSRKADERIFEADLLVDKAHLVMLKEQGLISSEVCSKIMAALDDLMQAGSQSLRLVRMCMRPLRRISWHEVGPEGGRMHTGRSRNDEVATCIRLALREEMLDLMQEQISLITTLGPTWRKSTPPPSFPDLDLYRARRAYHSGPIQPPAHAERRRASRWGSTGGMLDVEG